MKRISIFLFGLLLIWMCEDTWGTDLRGRFTLSATGGLSSMAAGFSSPDEIKHAYGFGISAEYFFLKRLSGGFALLQNCFQADWQRSVYDWPRHVYYSSDWNWTNLSIFGRFALGPQHKISPYLKAGVGLYIPRVKDWAFYPPDTTYTRTTYGKGRIGYYFGLGVQYLIDKRMLVYFEIPLNFIHTKDLVIHWVDVARRLEWYHDIRQTSQYLNLFVGVSFLLGKKK